MILIAHRGLNTGPDPILENHPDTIKNSLLQGYDCEIDVRLIGSNFYLGHDNATYPIKDEFLTQPGLWIHAKNLEALDALKNSKLNYFWHQSDDYVITSHQYIWAYPGKELTKNSICVMPEWNDPDFNNVRDLKCFGICSDFVSEIKYKLAN